MEAVAVKPAVIKRFAAALLAPSRAPVAAPDAGFIAAV
jgi:hypothetical protein